MPERRRITITLETDRRIVRLRRSATPVRAWCYGCDADVLMAAPETAALLAGVSARSIYRRIEQASVHFVETPDGLANVCLRSLGIDVN